MLMDCLATCSLSNGLLSNIPIPRKLAGANTDSRAQELIVISSPPVNFVRYSAVMFIIPIIRESFTTSFST